MKKIFLLCGANEGKSIERYKRVYGYYDHIHMFECNPFLMSKLKNLETDKITLHNVAVWVSDEVIDFYIGDSQSSTAIKNKKTGKVNYKSPVKVKSIDFSKWIKENIDPVDHVILVLDIEGAEYDVLEKMIKDDTSALIDELFVEYHHKKISGISDDRHNKLDDQLKDIFKNNYHVYLKSKKFNDLCES